MSGKPLSMVVGRWVRWGVLGVVLSLPAWVAAVETRGIRDGSPAQFAQGETTGIEVLSEGRLRVAPTLQRLERTSESVTWTISTHDSTATVYFTTGHGGRVFRSTGQGPAELWADLEEPQALSLAQDPTGGVFVGAAPGGRIYRILQAGKPELFFETGEKYVWSLKMEPTGALLAGTGTQGRVFRIWGKGNGSEIYKADQTNVMNIQLDRQERPLLGLQGKAALVRLEGPDRGYVMWSGPEDEVRSVAYDLEGGLVYAGVNGSRGSGMADMTANREDSGPVAGGVPSAPGGGAGSGPGGRPGMEGGPSGGGSGSTVIRVLPNGFVNVHWSAPEAPIHSLVYQPEDGSLLVAAGQRGRVWRVTPEGLGSIIADSDEGLVTALARRDGQLLLGTGNRAGLEVLSTTGTRTGIFQSRTLNAAGTVRWGNLHLDLDPLQGTSVTAQVRTGNTADANARSWSPFTTATVVASPGNGVMVLDTGRPVAQYLQYRLILGTDRDGKTPVVDGVQAYFLPANAAPFLRGIEFLRVGDLGLALPGGPGASASSARAPQGTAVAIRGGAGASAGGTPSPSPEAVAAVIGRLGLLPRGGAPGEPANAERPGGNNVVVTDNPRRIITTWDASDPNGDRLTFTVRIKAEDEEEWRLLEDNVGGGALLLATDTLPDGRHRVQVTASDEESNTPENALRSTLVSRILTIDNTPPILHQLEGTYLPDGSLRITGLAQDGTSTLAAGEFTVDSSKEPRLFLPSDGLFDSANEAWDIVVRPTEKRTEHVVTLRVFDREGNSSVGRVLVTVNTPKP